MKHLIITCLSLIALWANAQHGTIRGTVFDDATSEPLIGVTVFVKGTTTGTTTDLDGKFSISIAEGKYDLQVSYISYQTLTIAGLEVEADEVTVFDNIRLKTNSQHLETVVVTAEATRRTETALMAMKKRSVAIIDGISAGKIELTGDATAVEAAKRVTGVTIEGGKYVYVRGLGDRYTKTTLNGVDVPGLDPDRNSIQMDIFPTNLIDNLIVRKNGMAELPADFTGGLMDIETKAFPDQKFLNISFSTSYNPSMHFNPDYLAYTGGKTDFLGFDDGTRALPALARQQKIPTPISGHSADEVNRFVGSFNPELAASKRTSLLDYGLGFSMGNQIDLRIKEKGTSHTGGQVTGSPKLGYVFSMTYKSAYRHYDDVQYGEYQRYQDPSHTELRYATVQSGVQSERDVLIGLLGGVAYKSHHTKLKLTAMRFQNGESMAGQFLIDNNGASVGQSGYIAHAHNLEYNQRSLTNFLLNGRHVSEETGWMVDWRLSPTWSVSDNPDIRKTAFTYSLTDTSFNAGAGGNPARIWRYLDELSATAKVDLTKAYTFLGEGAKLKIGASHIYKIREYEILFFDIQFFGGQSWPDPDPAQVLDPDNIYPNSPNSIYYQSGNQWPNSNAYASQVHNTGVYISNEFYVLTGLKAILGLRAENYIQWHTGRDQRYASGDTENGRNLDHEKVLEALDLFPSANLIYRLSEDQNLRASYARTIARPSFKELSFAQILDPISNRIFNGSLFTYSDWGGKLVETRIDNFDLRWELFMKEGQIISVSGFYKKFDRPIELVRIPEQQTSTEYQPRNVGDGQLYGVELEVRKKLDFIAPRLSNFYVDANLTLVQSQIDMTQTEFNARKTFLKDGEAIGDAREMAGQSPYVVNAGLGYSHPQSGLDAALFYNVKGPTLEIVGAGLFPDIYREPFHSLNFGINKKLGKQKRTVLNLQVANILDDRKESLYQSFQSEGQLFNSLNPGRSFGIGISHRF